MKFYAHTREGESDENWEPLYTPIGPAEEECQGKSCGKCARLDPMHGHLNKVAFLAGRFAEEMFPAGSGEASAAGEWGRLAGLWHDLGKFSKEFQSYLAKAEDPHVSEMSGKVDHTSAGAQHAVATGELLGHFLAYVISGHHSGLLDALGEGACLRNRLKKDVFPCAGAPSELLGRTIPKLPASIERGFLNSENPKIAPTPAFFSRMLFSCLVDADFLATEAFMNDSQRRERPDHATDILERMRDVLDKHLDSFGTPTNDVDWRRAEILARCRTQADEDAGFFSLTVPTGGGKTLSSLAFALRQAIRHNMRRVIFVVPFTSIIEQNAAVFSEIFTGLSTSEAPVVLEHHSNLSPDRETTTSRLAAENWDAPLIVTTAVQFYESLHANKTSRSRKLHNIARSVVILDEAQALPVDYLHPCLESLRQLVGHYWTTVVLCTATQPAVHHADDFSIGLKNVREIMQDPKGLYQGLRRTKVVDRGELDDETLAAEIGETRQALAIVNTRKHAQELFRRLRQREESFHLSALMCPKHRFAVLRRARQALDDGQPVRLISTQLIEAGVDVDFPVVYRSLAGVDSIAQAAGRCNRNGRLKDLGTVHIFRSEHQRAEAYFRDTAQISSQILTLHSDPLSLDSVEAFFRIYYRQHNPPKGQPWDTKEILPALRLQEDRNLPFLFQFREVAEKFALIENVQVPVIVPFDNEGKGLADQLRNDSIPLNRNLLRGLQPYTVQIYQPEFNRNRPQFESVRDEQFHILICPEIHYSRDFGLNFNDDGNSFLFCG
jgi:CRISPR-associated endonuclease/helicase Cas3